jgi:hypothetical protein
VNVNGSSNNNETTTAAAATTTTQGSMNAYSLSGEADGILYYNIFLFSPIVCKVFQQMDQFGNIPIGRLEESLWDSLQQEAQGGMIYNTNGLSYQSIKKYCNTLT